MIYTNESVNQFDVVASPTIFNATLANPPDWFRENLIDIDTYSKQPVNYNTAMGVSAFFSAVRCIAEDVAKLPLIVYKKENNSSRERMPGHPAYWLLHDSPNEEQTAFSFRETMMLHALVFGNAYAEIVWRNDNRPDAMYHLDPTRVEVKRERTTSGRGKIYYEVTTETGGKIPLESESVLHLHGISYDGISGQNMLRMARNSIGNAIGSQKSSGGFFARGMTPSGVIEIPEALSDQAFQRMRQQFHDRYGGADNSYSALILEKGAKFGTTSIDPQKSQMLETMEFTVGDVARWFRIPPHKIGDLRRATFSNIEEQSIEYVTDCLHSWLVRIEQECNRKLFLMGEYGRYYCEHLVDAMLRGKATDRASFYSQLFQIGGISPNEIAERENLPTIGPDGDVTFVQGALVPISRAVNPPAPPAPVQPAPAPVLEPEHDEPDTTAEDAMAMASTLQKQFAELSEKIVAMQSDDKNMGEALKSMSRETLRFVNELNDQIKTIPAGEAIQLAKQAQAQIDELRIKVSQPQDVKVIETKVEKETTRVLNTIGMVDAMRVMFLNIASDMCQYEYEKSKALAKRGGDWVDEFSESREAEYVKRMRDVYYSLSTAVCAAMGWFGALPSSVYYIANERLAKDAEQHKQAIKSKATYNADTMWVAMSPKLNELCEGVYALTRKEMTDGKD